MKRILAMLLTVAMIATACPMAFADEVTEESNITATENLSAKAPENEATIQEEYVSLFAVENETSLFQAVPFAPDWVLRQP